jgi:RHS repeat-associated protein
MATCATTTRAKKSQVVTQDPWGNLLPSSYDDVPGGMPDRFVGSLGVRYDGATGLHYMRQRWYDAGLGRFVSRDPIARSSVYAYVGNAPTVYLDPLGLRMVVYNWGGDKSMQLFQQYLEQATGYKLRLTPVKGSKQPAFEVDIADEGTCPCPGTSHTARMLLKQIINSNYTAGYDLAYGESSIDFGKWAGWRDSHRQGIDLADMEAVNAYGPRGIGGLLHELAEGYIYAKERGQGIPWGDPLKPFTFGAHGAANRLENMYYQDVGASQKIGIDPPEGKDTGMVHFQDMTLEMKVGGRVVQVTKCE